MAYIPPHKRHSRDLEKPSLVAESLAPKFNRKLNIKPFGSKVDKSGKIVYACQSRSRWFSVGSSNDGNQFPFSVELRPISVESIERLRGEKPLALLITDKSQGTKEDVGEVETKPWEFIVENLLDDLFSSVERVKNEMDQDLELKAKFVARLGKVLFHGSPEDQRNKSPTETQLKQMDRTFYTNVSGKYFDNITQQVLRSIGVEFEEKKDIYYVKLSDANRPNATVSCKCIVVPKLNNLQLYKIDLNPVRHMVMDISCLKENMDLRLMMCTKKPIKFLTDDEMESIADLIKSAVIDEDAKGGLRWPMGKVSSGERFKVIGAWHTVVKSYISPLFRLKLRLADRFDFKTSIGESTREVALMLKQFTSELLRGKTGSDVISFMLKDHLKLIWNHFTVTSSASPPFVSP